MAERLTNNLTRWFSPEVKPRRVGVYQSGQPFGNDLWFRFWDGHDWHEGYATVSDAYRLRGEIITDQTWLAEWRGIASKPKATTARK